ncbi:hypothetical protein RUM44_008652 [Polyplax serrata]|uniref:Uncharacterized protein n=1 Tax=Polyplax serrata TaxID=468196 RepID=A0ABR1B8V3_POLSC
MKRSPTSSSKVSEDITEFCPHLMGPKLFSLVATLIREGDRCLREDTNRSQAPGKIPLVTVKSLSRWYQTLPEHLLCSCCLANEDTRMGTFWAKVTLGHGEQKVCAKT